MLIAFLVAHVLTNFTSFVGRWGLLRLVVGPCDYRLGFILGYISGDRYLIYAY